MVTAQNLTASAAIVQEVLQTQGRQGMAVKLSGLAMLVESMITHKVSPLDSAFSEVDCIKIVQNKDALRKAGNGSIYSVMSFLVKVYQYGMGNDRRRIVAAPEGGCDDTVTDLLFHDRYYDSIALTVTEDETKFNAMQHLGAVKVLYSLGDEFPVSGFVYTTKTGPNTLRFMLATTKVAPRAEDVEEDTYNLVTSECEQDLTEPEAELTNMFATV